MKLAVFVIFHHFCPNSDLIITTNPLHYFFNYCITLLLSVIISLSESLIGSPIVKFLRILFYSVHFNFSQVEKDQTINSYILTIKTLKFNSHSPKYTRVNICTCILRCANFNWGKQMANANAYLHMGIYSWVFYQM